MLAYFIGLFPWYYRLLAGWQRVLPGFTGFYWVDRMVDWDELGLKWTFRLASAVSLGSNFESAGLE